MSEADEHAGVETCEVEELHYGKVVVAKGGPLHPDADYEITYRTSGLRRPKAVVPRRLVDETSLSRAHVEPEWVERGALLFRAVDAGSRGLAAMRVRYRSEAGERVPGREYQQAAIVFLPKIELWSDIPDGFFGWCAQNLLAEPDVAGQERQAGSARTIVFKDRPFRGIDWLDTLLPERVQRLEKLFRMLRHGSAGVFGTGHAGKPSEREALLADDLDTITTLRCRLSIHADYGLAVTLGLDPALMPRGIRFTESVREQLPAEGSAQPTQLRQFLCDAAGIGERGDADFVRSGTDALARRRDSLGRIIGREPIAVP